MASKILVKTAALAAVLLPLVTASSCNSTALNTTVGSYEITIAGTTVFDVAKQTNRGVCDIGIFLLSSFPSFSVN